MECQSVEEDSKLRISDGGDGSIKGETIPNNTGLIVGLSVGVPLLILAVIGAVYWHNHHKGTIRLKGKTRMLQKAVSLWLGVFFALIPPATFFVKHELRLAVLLYSVCRF